jgi:hypothetical protein
MTYLLIALSLTLIVLIIGVISMAVGGKIDKKLSSKLMVLRVVLQGVALCCLALLYFSQ